MPEYSEFQNKLVCKMKSSSTYKRPMTVQEKRVSTVAKELETVDRAL